MGKKYWQNLEELNQDTKGSNDLNFKPNTTSDNTVEQPLIDLFDEKINGTVASRRDFLKMVGFSVSAAAIAASCKGPVREAIPYVVKPEEITPGMSIHYASTFYDGSDYCSILVKSREGRPIKIEGNTLSEITEGGTNARVQASILGLYDTNRIKWPLKKRQMTDWDKIDHEVVSTLKAIAGKNGRIVLLTPSVISPSTNEAIKEFINSYPSTEVIHYDTISHSAMLKANKHSFDKEIIPGYNFDKANVIISFGADFLGNWISPIEFTKQYVKTRKLNKKKQTMSYHVQLESNMSVTGSNADRRIPIKPSEEGIILVNLYNELAKLAGISSYSLHKSAVNIKSIAKRLWKNKSKSLVVSGTNDIAIQIMVNAINVLLDNYGHTIDFNTPIHLKQGIDQEMVDFVEDMNQRKIDAVIHYNVNPAYDYHEADKFIKGIEKVLFTISFSTTLDETALLVDYVCPDNHYLESWNDSEPKRGHFSLSQPTIQRLFDTRAAQESLLYWADNKTDFHTYIQKYWEENIFTKQKQFTSFKNFWNKSLQDGVFKINIDPESQPVFNEQVIGTYISSIKMLKMKGTSVELSLYTNLSIGDGKQANNPWLQEMPDPISKICWDNYVAISPKFGLDKGFENGSVINIHEIGELPIFYQPGQAYGTISVALGYGRTYAGKVGNNVGLNVFNLIKFNNGSFQYCRSDIKIEKKEGNYNLAQSQTHSSMENRPIVRETTLKEYHKNPAAGNEVHEESKKKMVTLYGEHKYEGFHWEMVIDLNACVGCGNCIIACQAENNVPVVGRTEVGKNRIMHWLRVDRYYSDDPENPQVVHQPIMCQHCDNAPCENVCPVSATMHSYDGLNQMAYNRCIGTRYCMNNCPYKMRRFNWFEYVDNNDFDFNLNDDLGKMVLNPDVVVRSRGVAEKCSFCVQRIQESKMKAKLENRILIDGEVRPACMQSCPAKAIDFGDINDKESKVAKLYDDERNYHVLEELHVLPSVSYMTKVRNQPDGNKGEQDDKSI